MNRLLLDYRAQERRKENVKRVIVLAIGAAIGALVWYVVITNARPIVRWSVEFFLPRV